MARKPLREWISALGPEASARDVLELAFYGVSALGYQTYYDETDVQSEVVELDSLVVIGRQPGRGDWAEFLDGTVVYVQPASESSWLTFEDHPSWRQSSPIMVVDSLEAVADVIERAAERADAALAAGTVPEAVVTDEEFRLRQLALDASANDIAMLVVDDPSCVKARPRGTGVDITLADGTRLAISDPVGGWREPLWSVRHDSPHLFEPPPEKSVSSIEEVVAAIRQAQAEAATREAEGRLPVSLVTPLEFELRQLDDDVPAFLVGTIMVRELGDNGYGLTVHKMAMAGEDSCLVEVRDRSEITQERMLIRSPRIGVGDGWTVQTTNFRTGMSSGFRAASLPELGRSIANVWRDVVADQEPRGATVSADLPPSFVESIRRMRDAAETGQFGSSPQLSGPGAGAAEVKDAGREM